jgi:hypothetical protein
MKHHLYVCVQVTVPNRGPETEYCEFVTFHNTWLHYVQVLLQRWRIYGVSYRSMF